MKTYSIRAKVPTGDVESVPGTSLPVPKTFMLHIGTATEMADGKILIRLGAIPLNWNGEAKLYHNVGARDPVNE